MARKDLVSQQLRVTAILPALAPGSVRNDVAHQDLVLQQPIVTAILRALAPDVGHPHLVARRVARRHGCVAPPRRRRVRFLAPTLSPALLHVPSLTLGRPETPLRLPPSVALLLPSSSGARPGF